MPPLPLVLDEETKSLIDNIQRRQKDLKEFQVPRLRDCKGPISLQQKLATELREDLTVFDDLIESLDIRADDLERKTDRESVKVLVDEFHTSSTKIRKDMRAALLHSKKVIDTQARNNREELFRNAVIDKKGVEDKATDDALMRTSNQVTDALRRTLGAMQSELERSVLSHQLLEQSTATLQSASKEHDTLTFVMDVSKQLITALEKADWMDRLIVLAALAFFVLVVLFILKERILDRSVRIAFFWTRFLPTSRSKEKLLAQTASTTATAVFQTFSSVVSDASTSTLTTNFPSPSESSLPAVETMLGTVVKTVIEVLSDASSVPTIPTETLSSILPSVTEILLEHVEL